MPTSTDSRLHALASAYRDALEAHNQAAADSMARAWLQAQERVSLEVQALLGKMEAARAAGVDISPAWLYQERRLANLTDTIRRETARWTPYAEEATRNAARAALQQGQRDAQALAREASASHLPGLEASFTDIQPETMASLMGHLAPGGPLRDLLERLGGEAADAAQTALVQGVILGKGSDWITRQLRTALDIPRWRAETIARTEALRAYRETSRLTMQGSNVVGSWVWSASLDGRCCAACVVMNGTEHPLTDTLDGHPRCRCAMIPRTKSWGQIDPSLADLPDTRPPVTDGKAWLEGQDAAYQRSLMGPAKYDAWKRGEFTLDDLVARTHSPDWGTMRRERSLLEIREGRNANTMPELDAPAPATSTWSPREGAGADFQKAAQEYADAHAHYGRRWTKRWDSYQLAGGPWGYRKQNALLRGADSKVRRDLLADWDAALDNLGMTTTEDLTMYRGILDATALEFREGATFTDAGVISTTANPRAARGFLSQHVQGWEAPKEAVLLELRVPRGTRMIGGHAGTFETMIRPGTQFRVVGTERRQIPPYAGTIRVVILEVIP